TNLFDAHPPFQIDGNFGATAGIAEMVMQSHDPYATPTGLTPVQAGGGGLVQLLPGLPSGVPCGGVTGRRGRRGGRGGVGGGGGGKLVEARLRATSAIPVKIRYAGKEKEVALKAGQVYRVGAGW